MAKKIQLSIPKPCHEDWDAMTPVEKGKFCGSCQKQVVDFSTMSDRQVAEFFKKPSTGSVCGRFMTDQLERDMEIPKKRIPWFKYFFQIVLPAFILSVKGNSARAQIGKIKVTDTKSDTTRPIYPKMGIVAPDIRPIKGDIKVVPKRSGTIQLKIVDEKGEAIPYASIVTGVIGKGGAADKNGSFKLDKATLDIQGKIFVSSAGYERKEILVRTFADLTGTFTVVLQENGWLPAIAVTVYGRSKVMGEIAMCTGTKKTNKDSLVVINHATRNDSVVKSTAEDAKFIVYPNPIIAGASIHISCQNFTEGYYHYQILDISGQMIRQSELWIDKETSLFDMPVPATATAGTYLVVLIHRITGKKFTEKIIVHR